VKDERQSVNLIRRNEGGVNWRIAREEGYVDRTNKLASENRRLVVKSYSFWYVRKNLEFFWNILKRRQIHWWYNSNRMG